MSDQPLTLAVLAGGEGSRMGQPKSLLQVDGKPILAYLLDRLAWPGPTILVTAPGREHPPAWDRFDSECVDPVAGEGPLRGVCTALENCRTEGLVVITCDMPLMTRAVLDFCASVLFQATATLAVIIRRRDRSIEPFPLVLRPAFLDQLHARLAAADRSVRALASLPGCRLLDERPTWAADVWMNLNHRSDFDRFVAEAFPRPMSPASKVG